MGYYYTCNTDCDRPGRYEAANRRHIHDRVRSGATTMNMEQQKSLIDQVKAATHGMPRDEKRRAQELILVGACLALGDSCPPAWRSLLMVGRANKLFGR
jgi:hypothetical protein